MMAAHGNCVHGIDRSASRCQRCEDRKAIAELKQQRDELLKDAMRYRYLRSLWKRDHFSTEVQTDGDPSLCDAAIDREMGEKP